MCHWNHRVSLTHSNIIISSILANNFYLFSYSALDMLYAFFLFWPANMIPIWLLVSLLQFFIPLNMLFRSCCNGLKHFTTHVIAGFIILVAVVLNMIDITDSKEDKDKYMHYALLFLLCSLFDVVSHALKE